MGGNTYGQRVTFPCLTFLEKSFGKQNARYSSFPPFPLWNIVCTWNYIEIIEIIINKLSLKDNLWPQHCVYSSSTADLREALDVVQATCGMGGPLDRMVKRAVDGYFVLRDRERGKRFGTSVNGNVVVEQTNHSVTVQLAIMHARRPIHAVSNV